VRNGQLVAESWWLFVETRYTQRRSSVLRHHLASGLLFHDPALMRRLRRRLKEFSGREPPALIFRLKPEATHAKAEERAAFAPKALRRASPELA
jgi:hypothetical protein